MGPAFLDLTVDSFSLNFGGYYAHTNTAKTHRGGLEVGLGFGIPLTGKAPGPWLRTKANFLTGGNSEGATIWVLVDWQFFVGAE